MSVTVRVCVCVATLYTQERHMSDAFTLGGLKPWMGMSLFFVTYIQ